MPQLLNLLQLSLSTAVAVATFGVVILLIALDLFLDMTVAAMLGVVVYATTGILTQQAIVSATEMASGPLALLFEGMVVAPRPLADRHLRLDRRPLLDARTQFSAATDGSASNCRLRLRIAALSFE